MEGKECSLMHSPRESNFTQEIFVSPVSRYSIIAGKITGCSLTSILQLAGVFVCALFLGISFTFTDILRVLFLSPAICLVSGAMSIFFCGLISDPKAANNASALIVIPQMFLSGAFIPVKGSAGLLGILTKMMPMTYSVDLARIVYYLGKPEYRNVIIYNPLIDILVTIAFFLFFSIVGTVLFTRAERNR